MKSFSLLAFVLLFVSGCSLVSPYTISFTNTPNSVVDPLSSTLDFVVSAPTLSYISEVACEGADPIRLLPIVQKDGSTSTLHKLALTVMKDMPQGSLCEVTVTVFDPTTTETASQSIMLTMPGTPALEEEEESAEVPEELEAPEEETLLPDTIPPLEPSSTDSNELTPTSDPAAPAGTEEPGA